MVNGWARTSLRVSSGVLTLQELAAVLGPTQVESRHGNWIVNLEQSSDSPVESQLHALEILLEEHLERFHILEGQIEITALLSWTPRVGQDGLAFPPLLLKALAAAGATLLLDTHTDDG